MFAAIDDGTICGAVYGVGATGPAAIRDAQRWSGDLGAAYRVVKISEAAAVYVRESGGAPSPRLCVRASGVSLADEVAP